MKNITLFNKNDFDKFLKQDVDKFLETLKYIQSIIKNDFNFYKEKEVAEANQIIKYMNSSIISQNFFSNSNYDDLYNQYMFEILNVVSRLGKEKYSKKEKILNYLEYFRLNCMYENIGEKASIISQSGINVALLGKGVCESQARFFNMLLIASGINSRKEMVSLHDNNNHKHAIVILKDDKDGYLMIDPTFYNGSLQSLQTPYSQRIDFDNDIINQGHFLSTTQDDIDRARKVVYEYLIEKYHIKELSTMLKLDALNDYEKQVRIITFLESILTPVTEKVNIRSVTIEGREVDTSKMLELFYEVNGIDYNLVVENNKNRYNCIFRIKMEKEIGYINSTAIFSKEKNHNPLSTTWMVISKDDNSFSKINDILNYPEIQMMISESRKFIRHTFNILENKEIKIESKKLL